VCDKQLNSLALKNHNKMKGYFQIVLLFIMLLVLTAQVQISPTQRVMVRGIKGEHFSARFDRPGDRRIFLL